MLNARFKRAAHVIALRFSLSFFMSFSITLFSFFWMIISARYRLCGANTPWNLVKFTRGEGTKAANESKLLGTFTLNLHITSDAPESERFGYLSDLFVAEGLENDANFIKQFISGVFSEIETRHPKVKVLSVMAAAGDPTIPIVKCFNHAKEAKLIHLFTRLEQERLGVVAQFTLKESNAGKTHFPPSSLGDISRLSLITEIRRRSAQKEASAVVSLPTVSVTKVV